MSLVEPPLLSKSESAFLRPEEFPKEERDLSITPSSATVTIGPPTGIAPKACKRMPTLREDLTSILCGLRNGIIYGCKIRFPHALVMTFLFVDGSLTDKLGVIIKKTREHSQHLGLYVMLYKIFCMIIRRIFNKTDNPLIHLLSGAIAGGIIWGKKTSVNHQINLYVFSRIFFGLIRSGIERGYYQNYSNKAYLIFAMLTWAIVMYLFEYEDHNISRSLKKSMDYLYHNDKPIKLSLNGVWNFIRN